MKKFTLIFLVALISVGVAFGQSSSVTGVVTSDDGQPLIGVAVTVAGTTTGTVTNAYGKYTISAPKGATLNFSYIGMQGQAVAISGRNQISVTMATDTKSLDEVVVLGYGTGRKVGTIIGSVSRVSNEKLEDRPNTNVVDALQGQVAGLNVMTSSGAPNATSSIRLHGFGSVNASNEPLIILDGGSVSSNTLLNMNPNDIESINVLKDASATSIYGSRAANGVIYVVSKKGRKGSDPVVTLRGMYAMSSPIQPKLKGMTTEQLVSHYEAYDNASVALGGDPLFLASGEAENFRKQGSFDWFKEIYKNNAPMYQTDLSVAGGGEKVNYFFSTSFNDTQGVSPGSSMSRYTFRSNIDATIKPWLKTGMNMGFAYSKSGNTFNSGDGDTFWFTNPANGSVLIPSYQNPRGEDGELLWLLDYAADYANPLRMPEMFPRSNNRLQLNGNVFVEIAPVKGLTLRSNLAANAYDFRQSNGTSVLYPYASGGVGSKTEEFRRDYTWTLTNTAEYKFSICQDHNVTILAGQESIYNSYEMLDVGMRGMKDPSYEFIGLGTLLTRTPRYVSEKSSFNSLFARVDYDYKGKYFFDFSVRDDASSRFAVNNRHAQFYAGGLMWNLKKEGFLADSKTISALNLRASYGTSGNAGIGDYDQYAILAGGLYSGDATWAPQRPSNNKLRWEKQYLLSVGASIDFMSRYHLAVEYYRRDTKDMLLQVPLSGTTGFSSAMRNVGAMRNSGVDLTVNVDIIKTQDWYFNFGANFNYNKSQVTQLFNGLSEYALSGGDEIMKIGSPYTSFYMIESFGVDPATGRMMYNDGNGGITYEYLDAPFLDLKKSWLAPYNGGFNFSVAWKGLALNADFAWTADRYMLNNTLYFSENLSFMDKTINQTVGALDYWKKPGDKSRYPSLEYQLNNGGMDWSSYMLENASYLRMKNIQLTYTFPQKMVAKSKFLAGAKVWVGGRNLWTLTKYRGLDPEVDAVMTADNYPNTRQWTFGLEFKF